MLPRQRENTGCSRGDRLARHHQGLAWPLVSRGLRAGFSRRNHLLVRGAYGRVPVKVPLENAVALAATIGTRVRALREAAGLTQEKLAYESGLRSKGTLSKIEGGHQLPSVAVLELLALRLGVELLDLFTRPGEGDARHDLIEATRRLSPAELRAIPDALRRAAESAPSTPFTEVPRPLAEPGPPSAIPLLGLDVAAGGFDVTRSDRGTRWVRPLTARKLHEGCFVVRVVGRSMEPTIADGSWAIFTRRVSDNPSGKVVLAQCGGLVDADTAASYTVKRFRATSASSGEAMRWSEVRLEPDNLAFAPIVVRGERLGDLSIVAELVEVLGARVARDAEAAP